MKQDMSVAVDSIKSAACLYSILRKHWDARGTGTYRTPEVLGPEHEFSVVEADLNALPIVDRILKGFCGRVVNFVVQSDFTFGKELQMHVLEVQPNFPFRSPGAFEETIQKAVVSISDYLRRKHGARLLGTGMHPLLRLEETGVWPRALSLSNIMRERVERKAQKTEFKEAIVSVYSRLAESLMDNQPYF